jgi:hypothetical protein
VVRIPALKVEVAVVEVATMNATVGDVDEMIVPASETPSHPWRNDVCPVPPLLIGSVPVVSESAIPSDEVANWIHVFPGPPMRSDDEAMVASPVPPFAPPKVPVTSDARLTSEVPTTPAVARRIPFSAPIESVFETRSAEVDANDETVRSDVVAFDETRFVVVPVVTESCAIEEDARMLMPSVVVGVSAPFAMVQSRIKFADVVESLLLNADQSVEVRQPKVEPDAVLQVTFPAAYVRPPEYVVVATPTHWLLTYAST